jgi:hypothetical protein
MKKVTLIDTVADRDIIPSSAMEDIREMWVDREFGNDHYYARIYLDDLDDPDECEGYENLYEWLRSLNLDTDILIRFWW